MPTLRWVLTGVKWLSAASMMTLALGLGFITTEAQQSSAVDAVCASCHPETDVDRRRASLHAQAQPCMTCHHVGFSNDAAVSTSRRLEACVQCHVDVLPSHPRQPEDSPACTECHSLHTDPVIADAGPRLSQACTACHEATHPLHQQVDEGAPLCTQCHSAHTGRPIADDARLSRLCEACHQTVHPSHAEVEEDALLCTLCHAVDPEPSTVAPGEALSHTCESCHRSLPAAHASVAEGAPLCDECHSFANDATLTKGSVDVSRRCGACHADQLSDFESGGHAAALARDHANGDVPDCVACHRAHADPLESPVNPRLAATARCMECHSLDPLIEKYDLPENVSASYRRDFHGATLRYLLSHPGEENPPDVMVCADCHGAHAVGSLSEEDVAVVCTSCHEEGDAKLAGAWMGHEPIGPENQAVIWLLRLAYFVCIPLVVGGLILNVVFHLQDQRRKGATVLGSVGVRRLRARFSRKGAGAVPMVTRFSVLERAEHLGAMVTFMLLVITGLPQTRPDSSLGSWIMQVFGGIGATRTVHRLAGFLFVTLLILHVGRGVVGAIRKRRLPAMMMRRRDFRDALQALRHYVGGSPRPKVGRFDYGEKFEYWGLFLGGLMMTGTGLVLVFPELVTQWLPGVLVAAARVAHGLEATLAVLVIVVWHTYGVILRPEIFPLDTSMFTGKISLERLREEHELEYLDRFPAEDGAEPEAEAAPSGAAEP